MLLPTLLHCSWHATSLLLNLTKALPQLKVIDDNTVKDITQTLADVLLNCTLPVLLCFVSDKYIDALEQMLLCCRRCC